MQNKELIQKFTGTGVAMVTCFKENGQIDYESQKTIIDHLINNGINYIVVLGTTGEAATLTKNEKKDILKFVGEYVNNRVPLVAGIGGNFTQEVLDSLHDFETKNYDAILSVAPYYNKPSQEGLYQHYKFINTASPLPIIMYNVPGRTGQNISAETTLRIANDCKNIFATKEACGNIEQIMQIIKNKPKGFEVISGDDNLSLPLIAAGAVGVISVVANAYPKTFSQMIEYCLHNKFTEAQALHYELIDKTNAMFAEGNPSGVKEFLEQMKLCTSTCRLPIVGVSQNLKDKIKTLL